MADETISCLKGYWISYNKFVDEETGELIRVIPYKNFANPYETLFPLHCYMQLLHGDKHLTIKDVIVIDDSQ